MDFHFFKNLDVTLLGYPGQLIDILVEKEYLDKGKYHLFANQFAIHSDLNGSWRGEFWGKFIRGACQCYKTRHNPSLYRLIEDSVFEMMSLMEEDGTLSAYQKEQRLSGWDVWGRKYAMIGFLSYIDICHSQGKKGQAMSALRRQADSFMRQVGPNANQKGILETAKVHGSMASASILGVYVDLYSLTKERQYLDFANYIISTGLSSGGDLIEGALAKDSYPYQWKYTKAYEMIACFQGAFRYGVVTHGQRYIDAAISFVRKVVDSEFTIIGGIGTETEFFDHGSVKQTELPKASGLETCVTVSFMGLCLDLLNYTGEAYYAYLLERMSYNALFGAFNDLDQSMALAEGRVWDLSGYTLVPHEKFYFDSYTPIVSGRRSQVVAGFMVLQDGHTYGCCAANGGYGLGLISSFALREERDGYVVDFYSSFDAKGERNGKDIGFHMHANLFQNSDVTMEVTGKHEVFVLKLRTPNWGRMSVSLNGKPSKGIVEEGYLLIDRVWGDDVLTIRFDMPLLSHRLNDKVAYSRGPIVLALDARLDGFSEPLPVNANGHIVENHSFKNNVTVELSSGERLCDFASAGKNMDDPHSGLSVWAKIRN